MPNPTSSPHDSPASSRTLKTTPKFQVPSLKTLAGQAVNQRHLFFDLRNKELPPEIVTQHIKPIIDQLVSEREKIYFLQLEERQEKIEELSSELQQQGWFSKLLSWAFGLGLTGLHVGIYFILRANDDIPDQTKLAFISSVPASFFVGLCAGACCLTRPLAWTIAYFQTPRIPTKQVIDLNEEAMKDFPTP
ncbi:Uncharacterised protein [Legionella donaldsonii]|uniref:Uncharacterized protein n=1 Tax=Legionella donaldsonii TaxID=45060 RepID=A0A378J165_9GAMM|nr:hypothetical protein [Legionella donaldsonii]STX41355.1 Uncharacterised protein [Legionella donaldsonii]